MADLSEIRPSRKELLCRFRPEPNAWIAGGSIERPLALLHDQPVIGKKGETPQSAIRSQRRLAPTRFPEERNGILSDRYGTGMKDGVGSEAKDQRNDLIEKKVAN